MIKRTISIAIAAGLMSALLLLGGTAVMSRISPVSAAQFPALIAGQSGRASDSAFQPVDSKNLDLSQDGKTVFPEASNILSASPRVSASALAAPRTQPTSSTSMQPAPGAVSDAGYTLFAPPWVSESSSATSQTQPASGAVVKPGPAAKVTIAQMLASPSSYHDRVVITTGRVTTLSNDKFLINDGTGQIIVDHEDDWGKVAITSGMTVTVVGELDDSGNGRAFEIDAYTLSDSGGAIAAGKQGDDDPARPTAQPIPAVGCDDDHDGDFDDDCGPDDIDDSGDDDSGDDDSSDDDSSDDDSATTTAATTTAATMARTTDGNS